MTDCAYSWKSSTTARARPDWGWVITSASVIVMRGLSECGGAIWGGVPRPYRLLSDGEHRLGVSRPKGVGRPGASGLVSHFFAALLLELEHACLELADLQHPAIRHHDQRQLTELCLHPLGFHLSPVGRDQLLIVVLAPGAVVEKLLRRLGLDELLDELVIRRAASNTIPTVLVPQSLRRLLVDHVGLRGPD